MEINRINQMFENNAANQINNACRRGPFVLEEHHNAEALANYSKQILPDSNYGQCGFSAFGLFTASAAMSPYTNLPFLQEAGIVTAVSVHFATNVYGTNTTEASREPHEFTVKFLTEADNYEFIGSNLPVSYIQDSFITTEMKHSLNSQDSARYWQLMANKPETINMLLHLLTDEGIPASYRTMRGGTVHAYKMINADGKEYFVKLRYIPKQGIVCLNAEEAEQVNTLDRHYATHDMYMAIERGDYPKWDVFLQVLNPEEIFRYEYDPLDPTNEWLEHDFPYHKIGTMTLNGIAQTKIEEMLQDHDSTVEWVAGRSHDNQAAAKKDVYKQAGDIYRSYREDVQKAVIHNAVRELSALMEMHEDIVVNVVVHFYEADEGLGEAIADGLGITLSEYLH